MLTRVTITGADDSTEIETLIHLSNEFPFVEWGILVSKRQQGNYRFPSPEWISKFSTAAVENHLNVSTHMCGRWVRDLLSGTLDWSELPDCFRICQRIQINTHAEKLNASARMVTLLKEAETRQNEEREFIFQFDGVNDGLAIACKLYGLKVAALFDLSGGAGRLPAAWPTPIPNIPCGYAGGLSDENVIEQLSLIEAVCDKPFWIDMERRVRVDDDSALDMARVVKVLELCNEEMRYEG